MDCYFILINFFNAVYYYIIFCFILKFPLMILKIYICFPINFAL